MGNYDDQIALLTKRVYHLEQEIIRLGGQPYASASTSGTGSVAHVSSQTIADGPYKTAQATVDGPYKSVQQTASDASTEGSFATSSRATAERTSPAKQKKDMENKIGKNVMAILASILIFFSLVLFAGIAFRYLSDSMKAAIMFIISAAIAVVGIIKMPKKNAPADAKYGVFFTALAACGIGAIYITDLVAYFGFKCISLVPFIISLAAWIVATMLLAYRRSKIFVYICNVGLIIATVLTALQFENSLLGFVIYTICLIALFVIDRHENFNIDCFYFIQYPIMFIVLSSAVDTNVNLYIIFALMLAFVFAYANFMYKITLRQFPTNLITALLNIAAIIRIVVATDEDYIAYFAIAFLLLTMAMYYFKHHKSVPALFYTVYVITYIVSIGIYLTTDDYIVAALVPYFAFLILGFMCRDLFIRIGGYLAILLSFSTHIEHFSFWPVFVIYLAIVLAALAYMYFKDYSIADKYILTFSIVAFVLSLITEDKLDTCFVFIILTGITFALNSKLFLLDRNTKETEEASQVLAYIACGFMIAYGLFKIASVDSAPEIYQAVIYCLMTLALCLINTKKLFEIKVPEMIPGTYLCLKFSALIFAILYRLSAESFIISVAGILVAIVCIILGFRLKHKSFRLYGLVVSLICVIKLILFDIKYDSFLLRPVGFFVAGILCFAISFIYSRLEKSAKE